MQALKLTCLSSGIAFQQSMDHRRTPDPGSCLGRLGHQVERRRRVRAVTSADDPAMA